MNLLLTDTARAGRMVSLLGWCYLLAVLGLAGYLLLQWRDGHATTIHLIALVACAPGALFAAATIAVGRAVQSHRRLFRLIGLAVCLLSLPAFPVGTVIGAMAIYYFVRGWND